MADQTPNTNQSPDNATPGEDVIAPMSEFGPNGLPVNPPQGEAPADVNHDLIMNTFFGDGGFEPNSAAGQAQGSNAADGQSTEGSLAPPAAAPAANGGEGSPQPGPSPTQQPAEQAPAGDGAPQTPGPQTPSAPEAPTPAPGLTVEDRLALASVQGLRQQNEQLLERLRQFEQGGQPQGQGQQPQSTQPGVAPAEQPLRLTVPDQLYQAIFDENPATSKQAVDLLVTAVAHNAVTATLAKVQPMIDARLGEVLGSIESGKKVQSMEEAYFERFPAHKNELYRPLIQSVTDEKYKAFPHAEWNEMMIDAVGSTVNAKLAALGINASQPAEDQNQPAPNGNGAQPQRRPQPAPMLDASARGGGVPQDSGDFISNTFN